MDLDHTLSQALQQYGNTRRRIGHTARSVHAHTIYPTAVDALQWIRRLEQPNASALAASLSMTRGGVSKLVPKLEKAGWAETFRMPDNRKEVYIRLTPLGLETITQVEAAYATIVERELAYFSTLQEDEKHAALRFIQGFTAYLQETWPENRDE